jgi:hypothetical protein
MPDKREAATPLFAIKNDTGAVLGVLKSGDDYILTASHIAVANPLATQVWSRSQMIDIRNALNKALNKRG